MPDVSRLRELLAEGVPLPWEAPAQREDEDGYSAAIYGNVSEDEQGIADVIRSQDAALIVAAVIRSQDAALIVAAVNVLPKFLDERERLREAVEPFTVCKWDGSSLYVGPCGMCVACDLRAALASLETET
jgi:hypothetical protein